MHIKKLLIVSIILAASAFGLYGLNELINSKIDPVQASAPTPNPPATFNPGQRIHCSRWTDRLDNRNRACPGNAHSRSGCGRYLQWTGRQYPDTTIIHGHNRRLTGKLCNRRCNNGDSAGGYTSSWSGDCFRVGSQPRKRGTGRDQPTRGRFNTHSAAKRRNDRRSGHAGVHSPLAGRRLRERNIQFRTTLPGYHPENCGNGCDQTLP